MLDRFFEIGFRPVLGCDERVYLGEVKEYKYYPEYLIDKHYTLEKLP